MPGQLARLKGALNGRRIAVSSVLLTALCCGNAYAVGLGEIELNSALNQKFDAQIELTEARGLQPSEVVVRLGSNEDFARVGVERFFFLTDLKFKVVQGKNNKTYLAVTSSQPISEPFLNFVVQVIWPNGRLLKEYTVLLDPPAFTDNVAPAVASPGRTDPGGGAAGRVDRPAPRTGTEVALTRPAPPRSAAPSSRLNDDGTYGVTDRDDTLWTIASRSRPAGASVQQTMLAIARMNPEAFIGGNINLLKAGYVLRLPSEGEVKSLGSSEAIAAVAEHNQAWQTYRQTGSIASVSGASAPAASMAGQVDATATRTGATAARPTPEGELRIVAGDVGATGGTGTGGGQAIEALEAQLAATEEEVERVARERDEAVGRLDQTVAQAEQALRQIEVRDQQIAQLQSQLDAAKQTADGTTEAPSAPPPPSSEGGLMGLLASPIVWVVGGVIAVLLLVVGLISARRRRAAADSVPLYETRTRTRDRSEAPVAAPTLVTTSEQLDADEPTFDDEEEVQPAATAQDDDEHARAQTSDVIGEADIYIAYGRYPQALNLLVGALEEDPDRSDVRLKLLEIYADTKDGEAFERQMAELVERCDDNEILLDARELATKLRDEGGAPDAKPAAAAEADELTLDDFDLDLDEPAEHEADAEASAPALDLDEVDADRGRGDELGGDLGLDFDSEARSGQAHSPSSRGARDLEADGSDLAVAADGALDDEFDLEDLELEPEAPQPSGTKTASKPAAAAADDAFDFLDEEDTASTKLDLARAYIDMGDEDGAKEILSEVLQEGSSEQQKQANELLTKLA